jgi:hypothetical protein
MKGLISFVLLLSSILQVAPAFGETLGFVRVQVVQSPRPPPSHTWLMKLQANGTSIGVPFSHAGRGFGWTSLTRANLSPTSASTPITAAYGNIGVNGCEFEFEIFFSFTSGGNEVYLGRFKAPNDNTPGNLPIGLRCAGSSGEVCSDIPSVRDQLVRMQSRQRIEEYNRWKREYDAKIRSQIATIIAKEAALSEALDSEDEISSDLDSTPEAAEAKASIDKLGEENSAAREIEIKQLSDAAIDQTTSPELLAENAAQVVELAAQERFRAAIDAKREELIKTGLGAYVVGYKDLMQTMDDLIQMQRDFARSLRTGEAEATEIFDAHVAAAQMQWAKYTLSNTGPLVAGAKAGIRLVAGDVVDACEALSGKEFCGGRELTFDERLRSTVSVVWGNREMLTKLEQSVEEKLLEEANSIAETLDDLQVELDAGPYMAELIINEIVDGKGKIVGKVLAKMNSGELSQKPLILSLKNGELAIISPDEGNQGHWLFKIQSAHTESSAPKTAVVLEATLDSTGRIRKVVVGQ